MNPSHTTSRGLLPLSSLAAGLAMATTGAQAVLVTSSGPVSVPVGTVLSNIGGVGLQVQNYFAPDGVANVYLGIGSGFLHKNALAGGTDVSSVAFDFPFHGQTLLTPVSRSFDNVNNLWEAPIVSNAFVIGQEHNYYGFKTNSGLYGWIDLKAVEPAPFSGYDVTVNGWAYDDSGASLLTPAAAVPEPGTLAMAAAGMALVGAAARRRRQQQRQAA